MLLGASLQGLWSDTGEHRHDKPFPNISCGDHPTSACFSKLQELLGNGPADTLGPRRLSWHPQGTFLAVPYAERNGRFFGQSSFSPWLRERQREKKYVNRSRSLTGSLLHTWSSVKYRSRIFIVYLARELHGEEHVLEQFLPGQL